MNRDQINDTADLMQLILDVNMRRGKRAGYHRRFWNSQKKPTRRPSNARMENVDDEFRKIVREGFRETQTSLREVNRELQETRVEHGRTQAQLENLREELKRARNQNEEQERRITTIEATRAGGKEKNAGWAQWLGIVVAVLAVVVSVVGALSK